MRYLVLSMLFLSLTVQATFLDPRDIKFVPPVGITNGMTEKEFHQTLEHIRKIYVPYAKEIGGGRLQIRGNWKSGVLNAKAAQFLNSWAVDITGGLARHPALTADGLSLIICHEIGHHLGGFPYYASAPFARTWAATEGQSDYYSTHVCARKIWGMDLERNATYRDQIPAAGMNKCDQVFMDQQERNLCYRITAASLSVTNTMSAILNRAEARLETPDMTVRETTHLGHPGTQCRLDTLFQGSICAASADYKIIPGIKVRPKDSLDAEKESAQVSCSDMMEYADGLRPACWFKARL